LGRLIKQKEIAGESLRFFLRVDKVDTLARNVDKKLDFGIKKTLGFFS
jgi:hypothetical protein